MYAQKVVQRQRRSWRRCEAEGRGSVQALQSTVAERLRLCLKTSCGSDPTTSCCTSRRSSRSVEIHRRLEEGSMSTCMKCLSRHSGSRLQVDLARLYIITTVIYRQRTLSIEMLTSDSSTAGDVNRRMLIGINFQIYFVSLTSLVWIHLLLHALVYPSLSSFRLSPSD